MTGYPLRRPSTVSDDDESVESTTRLLSVPVGHVDFDTRIGKDVAIESCKPQQPSTPNGEMFVTIVSAILLFSHFGITLYKIEADHPETSLGKQHLKERWTLINVCIIVFALASHLYRQALSNLSIKFAPIVLVPDFCTTSVVFLILTKHIYFALYLLMAGVTFLSVTVTICDMYAYFNPSKTVTGSKELYRSGEHKKEDEEAMDSSMRSVDSTGSSLSASYSSNYSARVSSNGVNSDGNKGRKKATRSILKKDMKPSVSSRRASLY